MVVAKQSKGFFPASKRFYFFFFRLSFIAALFFSAVFGEWFEKNILTGPLRLTAGISSGTVVLAYQSGELQQRTIAFYARKDKPIQEIADLTDCILVDRSRGAAGITAFTPRENGTYYFAVVTYLSIQSNLQNYSFLPADKSVLVDFLTAPTKTNESKSVSPEASAPTNGIFATPTNTIRVMTVTNAVDVRLVLTNLPDLQIQYESFISNLNERHSNEVVYFAGMVTNLMDQFRSNEEKFLLTRDKYFSREAREEDQKELSELTVDLRELYAALYRFRMDTIRPPQEYQVYPLLARYTQITARLQKGYFLVVNQGLKWSIAQRLAGEWIEVSKEVTQLYDRLLGRLRAELGK